MQKRYFIICVFQFFLLSCRFNSSDVENHPTINVSENAYTLHVGDRLYEYVYEYSYSNDGSKYICTYIDKKTGEMRCSLSIKTGIFYAPVINNKGDFAYCLYTESNSSGAVYLNENLLLDNGLYNDLVLTDKEIIVNYERLYDDRSFLIKVNLDENSELKYIPVNYYLRNSFLSEDGKSIYYEGFNKETYKKELVVFDLNTCELKSVEVKGIPYIVNDKIFILDESTPREDILCVNAVCDYLNTNRFLPFSVSNNHLGRLSWNESYRLMGLNELYLLTNSDLVKRQIEIAVKNILSRYNIDKWKTKKYSISGVYDLNLMVDDSMLLLSLLYSIPNISSYYSQRILELSEFLFTKYEENWNVSDRGNGYYFEYGIDFWADGVIQPWNQQNAWGLCLVELYKYTNNQKYKNRLEEMMSAFRLEWVYENGTLIWHYWPMKFYAGWSAEDNISKNTPFKKETIDTLFEDLSHASINVGFILKYRDCFSDELVSESDINNLKTTLGYIMKTKYSRFIKTGSNYPGSESLKYFPAFEWVRLDNPVLKDVLVQGIPYTYLFNDFDTSSSVYSYCIGIDKGINVNTRLIICLIDGFESKTKYMTPRELLEYGWY